MSFRLAALLRVRRLQADAAASTAAAAAARSAAAHRAVAGRRAELAATAAPHQADAWQFRSAVAARSARSSLLTEAAADADGHERGALAAREAWAVARRDLKALEQLEERHLAAQSAAVLAAEQLLLDEHAARAHAPTGPVAR